MSPSGAINTSRALATLPCIGGTQGMVGNDSNTSISRYARYYRTNRDVIRARRMIPCPGCRTLFLDQRKEGNGICQKCWEQEREVKSAARRICPQCGAYKHQQSKLCRNCYLASKSQSNMYENHLCQQCGECFRIHVSLVKDGQGKYCSIQCYNLGRIGKFLGPRVERHYVHCVYCHVSLEKRPSDIRKNKTGKFFCTHTCWYAYNQKDNHYGWTGTHEDRRLFYASTAWKIVSQQVWERDNAMCQRCFVLKAATERHFHIHHIVPFPVVGLRYELQNLLLLCKPCHGWVHSRANTEKLFLHEASAWQP